MTFTLGHTPAPKRVDITEFQPGDSTSLRILKVTRWALARGGTFSPLELQARFHCSRSMAYSYAKDWRTIFGTEPPPRARVKPMQATCEPAKPTLDQLMGE